jgi:hypothetical protein
VQDDSVLLQREEKVEAFEDRTPDEIARELIEGAGLEAETESVPDAGSSFSRFYLRRGTAMSALRELARRRGMFVYVRPGAQPGASVVVFARPNLAASALPELLLMGASRNVNELSIEFDALRLAAAEAGSVRIADKAVLAASAAASNLEPLGDRPAHDVVEAARVLLARTREEQTDLDEAVQAAVNLSSWAYTARGEVSADTYTGVLQAHSVVPVAGVGAVLSGNYLVSRVTHTLDSDSYRQRFTLLRNARLDGSSGGGLPAGVF